jgi:predicted MFS family arabinose efflux permease
MFWHVRRHSEGLGAVRALPPASAMTASTVSGSAGRREVLTVYLIGLFQGLSLVAFPAAATILTSPAGYDLSKSQYGLMFVPQVAMAISGSLALPSLAGRFSLKRVLLAGLLANTVAMGLLAGSDAVQSAAIAYPMLLVATGALGLGFGLTLGSISTYAGAFMPDRRDVALTALNVLLGLGTALSPFLIALFTDIGQWWYLPLLAAAGLLVLIALTLAQPMDVPAVGGRRDQGGVRPGIPRLFWVFAAALVIYGVGETMFGNWGTTLLVSKGVSATSANDGLAVFWAAVTVGRLVIAVVSTRLRSAYIYVVLPWAIAAALLAFPAAGAAGAGIGVFALGGLACSGFFPMTVGYGEATFPSIVELAAGWLIAAYQLGYGLAAFGAGALQHVVSLTAVFRIAAVAAAGMGLLAAIIARRQQRALAPTPSGSTA